ncbi:hypothetical protein ABZW44_22190 [Streptomyces mirabilis]|uniref:hypothetical protein n=1 Tax=Streptomyces mirabilis TaxID=68239 RepID=UPI0033B9C0FD
MAIQLEFQDAEEGQSALDMLHVAALAAVDLERHPGFATFTTGAVAVKQTAAERIEITTDNQWAASAIRTALRRSGCAVEADRGNVTSIVAVWAIGESSDDMQAETKLVEERDEHGRTILLLEGPDGTVEQQCGSGGHNDLIVHARHPFAGSARIECPRHGAGCWIRSDWPWKQRTVRSCIKSVVTDTGYAWQVAPEAEVRMRDIYRLHIHRTRRTGLAPTFHPLGAPAVKATVSAVTTGKVPSQPAVSGCRAAPASVAVPRQGRKSVDVIGDLADFKAVS